MELCHVSYSERRDLKWWRDEVAWAVLNKVILPTWESQFRGCEKGCKWLTVAYRYRLGSREGKVDGDRWKYIYVLLGKFCVRGRMPVDS